MPRTALESYQWTYFHSKPLANWLDGGAIQ
jgi:hypothetical protein